MKNGRRGIGNNSGGLVPFHIDCCYVPQQLIDRIRRFLLDKETGNVQLNIRDGKVQGYDVREIHQAVRGL